MTGATPTAVAGMSADPPDPARHGVAASQSRGNCTLTTSRCTAPYGTDADAAATGNRAADQAAMDAGRKGLTPPSSAQLAAAGWAAACAAAAESVAERMEASGATVPKKNAGAKKAPATVPMKVTVEKVAAGALSAWRAAAHAGPRCTAEGGTEVNVTARAAAGEGLERREPVRTAGVANWGGTAATATAA